MLGDKEIYKGFTSDEIETYKSEAATRWPGEYADVDAKIRRLGKEKWEANQCEGEEINRELAALVGGDPASSEIQELVGRHHAWIEKFYPADSARYVGLAEMYVTDSRFAAYYDKYGDGLAEFLSAGMRHFAQTQLA